LAQGGKVAPNVQQRLKLGKKLAESAQQPS
jgi:hypothetical protein